MSASMWVTVILLAFGLSMDAFAVSITNGLYYRQTPVAKTAMLSGLAFGLFQGIMPLIGYLVGNTFSALVESVDHWIALILLGFIGGRMIWEALRHSGDGKDDMPSVFTLRTLLVQAVATSIDALAVGVSIAMFGASIMVSVSVIAAITFLCSFAGVLIGHRFGGFLGKRAEVFGGVILIFIGLRIFLEHMGVVLF